MAISRGKRNKARRKAEEKEKKKLLVPQQPATFRKKRKKRRKARSSDESTGAARLQKQRKVYRNKAVKQAKRQHKKELKQAKKARAKAKQTKEPKQKVIEQPKQELPQVPETPAQQNYLDDIIYSTFDSMLRDQGSYDDLARQIVDYAIKNYGFDVAMDRLENYMSETRDKLNIFEIPLWYKDAAIEAITRFASAMYGRALSVSELDTFNTQLDELNNYEMPESRTPSVRGLNRITDEEEW